MVRRNMLVLHSGFVPGKRTRSRQGRARLAQEADALAVRARLVGQARLRCQPPHFCLRTAQQSRFCIR